MGKSGLLSFKLRGRFESEAVLGKFYGSGGQNKCNCLQDQANFHSSMGMVNCPNFYTPVWKTDVSCRGDVRPSVRPSVCPYMAAEIKFSEDVRPFSRNTTPVASFRYSW